MLISELSIITGHLDGDTRGKCILSKCLHTMAGEVIKVQQLPDYLLHLRYVLLTTINTYLYQCKYILICIAYMFLWLSGTPRTTCMPGCGP